MTSKLLEASAVVFLLFASFAALSAFGKAPAPAQYHAPAEIYPQGSGSGLDADTLDAKHASAFITSETDPTVAASVKDGVSWGEVSGRPSYSCGAANQGLKTIDLNTGAVSCETDDIGGGISGSGSANYVAKWASGTSLGNSIIYDNGNVGIGTASPGQKLTVAGTIESTSGGIKFPDGSVQTSAASGGNVVKVFMESSGYESNIGKQTYCINKGFNRAIMLRYYSDSCAVPYDCCTSERAGLWDWTRLVSETDNGLISAGTVDGYCAYGGIQYRQQHHGFEIMCSK